MKNKRIFGLILIFVLIAGISAQNEVKFSPKNLDTFKAKWNWATNRGAGGDYYVGYTIKRLMSENSHMGSWYGDDTITLNELIKGGESKYHRTPKSPAEYAEKILKGKKRRHYKAKKVQRELCFLFTFENGLKKIRFLTLNSQVKLKTMPVYWLGEVKQSESLALLKSLFSKTSVEKLQKSLIAGVSMHREEPGVFLFLKKVIYGKYALKVRSSAIFWVGELETVKTVNLLKDLVKGSSEFKIKKQAVFSLYRVNLSPADDALIKIARKGDSVKLRKQAIFWLGQKAVRRLAAVLGDIADKDPSSEIQNSAVFALSQLPEGRGIPKLIKIAKTHAKFRVRKKAIFWLGQSGDERALDTIVDILKSKK